MVGNRVLGQTAALLDQAFSALTQGQVSAAVEIEKRVAAMMPGVPERLLLKAMIARYSSQFEDLVDLAKRAYEALPQNAYAAIELANAYTMVGRVAEAMRLLGECEKLARRDIGATLQTAQLYTQCRKYDLAERCEKRALQQDPGNTAIMFNYASTLMTLGQLDRAHTLYNRVIQQAPEDYEAYFNRSNLRRQTDAENNIVELRSVLDGLPKQGPGVAEVCYALAKELEDIGDHKEAFAILKRGADAKRGTFKYDVKSECDFLAKLTSVYSGSGLNRDGHTDPAPVFILGLPRTGSTLVERILESHSKVSSLGEANEFSKLLMRRVGINETRDGIVKKLAEQDYVSIGKEYCDTIRGYGVAGEYIVDKTPINSRYVGAILTALPHAKIIHVSRNPMDSCYAAYKMLFRNMYQYSYSLEELGHHHLAYLDMIEEWKETYGDRFFDISYEKLVQNQESETRRLLAYCELDWEDACMNFHESAAPSATASSVQVRSPVYKSSLERWRSYEQELLPLRQVLESGGVTIE